MSPYRRTTVAAVTMADVVGLVVLRPDPARLRAGLADPQHWLSTVGADRVFVALAGAALWLVAVRVAVGLLAVALSHVPGAVGRIADSMAGVLLPAVLRRVVIGSAGLGVLLAPLAAHADGAPQPDRSPAASASASASPVPGPSWPRTELPGPSWPRTAPPSTPAPTTPAPTTTPTTSPRHTSPPPTSRRHSTPPPSATRGAPRPTTRVEVRPGDCLWMIAAHRLGPTASTRDVAGYVPRLYAENRDVVGADPDLVRPGQVLALPSPDRSVPPSTAQESP